MKDALMFGDNDNDLSMLEEIGLGVAMGNADDPRQSIYGICLNRSESGGN